MTDLIKKFRIKILRYQIKRSKKTYLKGETKKANKMILSVIRRVEKRRITDYDYQIIFREAYELWEDIIYNRLGVNTQPVQPIKVHNVNSLKSVQLQFAS